MSIMSVLNVKKKKQNILKYKCINIQGIMSVLNDNY